MMLRLLSLALLSLTVACRGDFPRDADGTLDRIRTGHRFNVALIAPLGDHPDPKASTFLADISRATGATATLETGDAEPLLARLKRGELDLVIGRFDKATPWAKLVTLGPPLRTERHGKTELQLVPVMKNGENAWIALIETTARDAAPEAQ